MNPYPDLSDGERPTPKPGHVWITRRRWDLYFLVGMLPALAISLGEWWVLRDRRFLGQIVPMLALWMFTRWQWPRQGAAVRTLRGTPGQIPLMKWLGAWGLVGIVLIVGLDRARFFPPEGLSYSRGQAAVVILSMVAWVAGLLVGVDRLERRFGKKKKQSTQDGSGID